MVSRKAIGASVIALALALAGCASATTDAGKTSGAPGNKDPFVIYGSFGVTGPVANIAAANVAGLRAAAAAVNAEGGIDGREVKVVIGDDGLDPAKATTLLQEQLDQGKIDLVVPGNTSNVGLAMIAAVTREGIMSSGQQTALADSTKYPNHFGMFVPNPVQVQSLVDSIIEEKHAGKVAILHANDSNGQSVGKAYAAAFDAAGIKTVSQEFAPADIDMTAQLQALQAEKPDVLILQGFGSVAGYTLKSRTKLGWEIPTYGHADYGGIDLSQISGPADWKNVKVLVYYPFTKDALKTAGYKEMTDQLKKLDVTINAPISQYALFWDLVHLAKTVWESTDSNDPKDLSAAWLKLDEKATTDSPYVYMPYYKFDPKAHNFVIKPEDAMGIRPPAQFVDGMFAN